MTLYFKKVPPSHLHLLIHDLHDQYGKQPLDDDDGYG